MHISPKKHHKRKNNTSFQRVIRWSALFLALSLTGCAARDTRKENDSAYVFETQFHSPLSGVEDFTVFRDSVYYSTFDGEFYQWTPGGDAQRLDIEPFTPEAYSRILQADFQGNLYVFYRVHQTDADPIANYLVKYDTSGKELARENISRLTRQFSPYETAVDAEERLYLMGPGRLLQFDGACNYVGAAETPEDEDLIWLAGDDGGHVYCCLRDTRTYRGLIREAVYDKEAVVNDQSASPEDTSIASLGNAIGEFQEGNHLATYGENRFLTSIGNALYLYDAATKTQTILLQWANCDINPDSVQRLATLADGRILVNLQEEGGMGELAVLTEVPKEQAVQKEVITLGILQASNSHLLRCVSQFNRNSSDCHIEIKEYYNSLLDSGKPEAEKEARTALHLDISSGQCPDILVLEYDDLETYASKGLLEDLSTYLDENAHLEISDNVLESYTFHGKFCALPCALQIRTIVGRTESLEQLGGKKGWTLEEMMDFIDSLPDKTVFSTDAG